jgi:glycopeptide antibiotics resistance protein
MSKTQGIVLFFLCSWLLLVLALTTLSRGANFTGSFNIDFFSAYVNAWNKWSISELQLIIFNMLMFTPLGFLLPLFWMKAEKFKVTLFVSIGLTVCIEIVQLLTGTGIFELDDLFHNCIGSLF